MSEHHLAVQLEDWQGQTELLIKDYAWLQAFAVPLLGQSKSVWTMPWDQTCLVSDRGWSAWISTFGNADPSYTEIASVSVGRGSPCRRGVWKTGVQDLSHPSYANFAFDGDPEKAELHGEPSRLRCARKVTFGSPYVGDSSQVFVVNCRLRLTTDTPHTVSILQVGFKRLHASLWWTRKATRCSHGSSKNETVTMSPSCCTVEGFGNYLHDTSERIIACLTAQCAAARWLALVAFPWTSFLGTDEEDTEMSYSRQILLRGQDCCFQCAINQAASQTGRWLIVL